VLAGWRSSTVTVSPGAAIACSAGPARAAARKVASTPSLAFMCIYLPTKWLMRYGGYGHGSRRPGLAELLAPYSAAWNRSGALLPLQRTISRTHSARGINTSAMAQSSRSLPIGRAMQKAGRRGFPASRSRTSRYKARIWLSAVARLMSHLCGESCWTSGVLEQVMGHFPGVGAPTVLRGSAAPR
jgi:hypothetical protein